MRPARLRLLSATLTASLACAATATAGEKVAVGARTGGGTNELYLLDLATGAASGWDVRAGGERLSPLNIQQNLFEAIGRPAGAVAPRGSIFLLSINGGGGSSDALAILEADTGYLGFLSRIGKDRRVGALLGAVGRPGLAAAAADGLHTLVPIANDNSSSRGFYLVHAGSGACVYLSGFDPGKGAVASSGCSALPTNTSGWASAPIRSDVASFVLVDVTSGASFRVRSTTNPVELVATPLELDLIAFFGETSEGAPVRRFSVAETWISGSSGMLVADAATGRLAHVTGLETSAPQIVRISATFPREAGVGDPRAVLASIFSGNGQTSGVLVFDATGTPVTLVTALDSGVPRTQAVELR